MEELEWKEFIKCVKVIIFNTVENEPFTLEMKLIILNSFVTTWFEKKIDPQDPEAHELFLDNVKAEIIKAFVWQQLVKTLRVEDPPNT